MQTAQGAARQICEHYYPDVARHMLRANAHVLRHQESRSVNNPGFSVYKDTEYCQNTWGTINTFVIPKNLTAHEKNQVMLLIWYGYPDVADCYPAYKPPKDSLNRLFLLLGRYNKLIKRHQDLNLPKILRGIVLKEAECVEVDPEDIPETVSEA